MLAIPPMNPWIAIGLGCIAPVLAWAVPKMPRLARILLIGVGIGLLSYGVLDWLGTRLVFHIGIALSLAIAAIVVGALIMAKDEKSTEAPEMGDNNTLVNTTARRMGSGNTIIGPTDDRGNVLLNRGGVAIGAGASADETSIAIGANAGAGKRPKPTRP